jgi:rubrerythrin
MALKDVFLLAANREKASHDFYSKLAAVHPMGGVRRLLEQLADQELEHKRRVEFLYTEVAFPQTDGG